MTIRNVGGVALFLAGTTRLWLTPAFASRGVSTSGGMWAATRVLCGVTALGFCVATWGLFARYGWWEAAALMSALLGVHVSMAGGVLVLLLVPQLERWVNQQVMGA